MGLDFGLVKIKKEDWLERKDDKKKFYEFMDNSENYEDVANWCGRGNPVEDWFRNGLKCYSNYDGFLMRPLTPNDFYKVIKVAKDWYDNDVDLKPVVMDRAFKEDAEENLTVMKIDGIEVMDEDQAYHRFYCEDSDGHLFMTKNWVDTWDIYKFTEFIGSIMNILINMDWEKDVLLYYVSY